MAANAAALPGYGTSGFVSVAGAPTLAVQLGDGSTGWSSPQIGNRRIGTLLGSVSWANSTASLGIDTTNGNATYGATSPCRRG